MPKLLILAPCQHVLYDGDKDASIIAILDGLEFSMLPNAPDPPQGTIIPFNWCVYVRWAGEPSDVGQKFEQRLLFRSPEGSIVMETGPAVFSFESSAAKGRMTNVISRFVNFPLASGLCPLSAEWRTVGEGDWHEAAAFPLSIEFKRMPEKREEPDGPKTVIWHPAEVK